MKFDWTDERIATLKRLFNDGLTALEIAAAMGLETRGPVCGKIDRLKLKRPIKLGASSAETAAKIVRRKRVTKHDATPARQRSIVQLADALEATDIAADASPYAVTFDNLRDSDCKWPLGDPADLRTFRFCGAFREQPGPYCGRHTRMAYAREGQTIISDEDRARAAANYRRGARAA